MPHFSPSIKESIIRGTMLANVTEPPQGMEGISLESSISTVDSAISRAQVVSFFVFDMGITPKKWGSPYTELPIAKTILTLFPYAGIIRIRFTGRNSQFPLSLFRKLPESIFIMIPQTDKKCKHFR